ncbi:MAG: HPr family phosphocarrier protein [bacterium]
MPDKNNDIVKSFTIRNTLGLHARAASAFVKIANRFQSEILVRKDDAEVNGKSIMGVLMLAAAQGTEIAITARGGDASEALDALGRLIDDKFGEN